MKIEKASNILITTIVLSWVAGYIDTAGFLGLNGLFTAHVTGNLVVAGAQLAGASGEEIWVRLAVVPVFIAAIVLTTTLSRTRHPKLSSFLWLQVASLICFAWVGTVAIPDRNVAIAPLTMFTVGSIGVFAMGIQNALMRESLGSLAPTTVMTGNLTQFTIDIARSLIIRDYQKLGDPELKKREMQELRQRQIKFGVTLIGFILGAAFGAFFMKLINFWAILLPAIAIAFLAIDSQRE